MREVVVGLADGEPADFVEPELRPSRKRAGRADPWRPVGTVAGEEPTAGEDHAYQLDVGLYAVEDAEGHLDSRQLQADRAQFRELLARVEYQHDLPLQHLQQFVEGFECALELFAGDDGVRVGRLRKVADLLMQLHDPCLELAKLVLLPGIGQVRLQLLCEDQQQLTGQVQWVSGIEAVEIKPGDGELASGRYLGGDVPDKHRLPDARHTDIVQRPGGRRGTEQVDELLQLLLAR
jgi:hypothetical protein